jgi:AcrR family transcriptional regulator
MLPYGSVWKVAVTRTPRERWIEEAMRALAAGGPDAVKVEPLAKAIGVTKGGFYWHFEGRPALLEEVLDAWERASVTDVIERLEGAGGSAREKLDGLFALAAANPEIRRADLAIRDWARRDPAVAERLRRVDGRRMDYLRSLFAGISDEPGDVEARCLLTMSLFTGSDFVAVEHPGRSRREVMDLALRLLER